MRRYTEIHTDNQRLKENEVSECCINLRKLKLKVEMDKDKVEPSQKSDQNQIINYIGGYVTLPFDQEQFKDFVIGLLGRPQTFEKRIYGRFEINLQDIQNFHYLINQRLTQQNNALLIQFRAKIYYADNSSITLNSLEDLITYNEVRPLISVAVDLSWNYLIQFNHKKHPEKQEINVRIWTKEASKNRRANRHSEVDIIGSSRSQDFFDITISYTARTWGMDIEALLTSHIQSLIYKEKEIKNFIEEHNGWIGLSFGILFFTGTVIGALRATNLFVEKNLAEISQLINSTSDVSGKINVIAQFIVNGESTRYYLLVAIFLFVALIGSFIVAGIVTSTLVDEDPSFLLLTQGASRNKQQQIKKIKTKWRNFVLSIIFSVITNIVASYIFVYLTRQR